MRLCMPHLTRNYGELKTIRPSLIKYFLYISFNVEIFIRKKINIKNSLEIVCRPFEWTRDQKKWSFPYLHADLVFMKISYLLWMQMDMKDDTWFIFFFTRSRVMLVMWKLWKTLHKNERCKVYVKCQGWKFNFRLRLAYDSTNLEATESFRILWLALSFQLKFKKAWRRSLQPILIEHSHHLWHKANTYKTISKDWWWCLWLVPNLKVAWGHSSNYQIYLSRGEYKLDNFQTTKLWVCKDWMLGMTKFAFSNFNNDSCWCRQINFMSPSPLPSIAYQEYFYGHLNQLPWWVFRFLPML